MKKTMKTMAIACAIGTCLVANASAQDILKATPGALMMVYPCEQTAKPSPDAEFLAAVVDNGATWSTDSLKNHVDTASFEGAGYIVWDGYLSILEDREYTFSLAYKNQGNYGDWGDVTFDISGKQVVEIHRNNKNTSKYSAVKSLRLQKGDYHVQVTLRYERLNNTTTTFDLKYWPKTMPLRKTELTPASLLHAE